jgi:hypothetical protein
MPDRLLLISAIIDVATSEQPRSLKEFVRWPRLPIREMYLARVVINLVYFARNYLNFVLLFVAASAFMFPMVLLVLGAAVVLHVVKKQCSSIAAPSAAANSEAAAIPQRTVPLHIIQAGAKALQVAMCLLVTQQYGFFTLVFVSLLPMLIVAAHAALTPYTDDAMEHYESVMASKGFRAPAPRSPTKSYDNIDKMFQGAIMRPVAPDDELASTTSYPLLSPRQASAGVTKKTSPQKPNPDNSTIESHHDGQPPAPPKPKRLLSSVDDNVASIGGTDDHEKSSVISRNTSARLMPASSSLPVSTMRRRDR